MTGPINIYIYIYQWMLCMLPLGICILQLPSSEPCLNEINHNFAQVLYWWCRLIFFNLVVTCLQWTFWHSVICPAFYIILSIFHYILLIRGLGFPDLISLKCISYFPVMEYRLFSNSHMFFPFKLCLPIQSAGLVIIRTLWFLFDTWFFILFCFL